MIKKFEKYIKEEIEWWEEGDVFAPIKKSKTKQNNDFITDTKYGQKFRQFLIDNDCYEQYLSNVDNFHEGQKFKEQFDQVKIGSYIRSAFKWENTPEGYYYWQNLSIRWTIIIIH